MDDVQNVRNPLNKVVAGLQSTGDSKIPLTAVHVRAKLQHLASEVWSDQYQYIYLPSKILL